MGVSYLYPAGNGNPKNPGPTNLYNASGNLRGGAEPWQGGSETATYDTRAGSFTITPSGDPTIETWGDADDATYGLGSSDYGTVRFPLTDLGNPATIDSLVLRVRCASAGGSTLKSFFYGLYESTLTHIYWQGLHGANSSLVEQSADLQGVGPRWWAIFTLWGSQAADADQIARIASWLGSGTCWFALWVGSSGVYVYDVRLEIWRPDMATTELTLAGVAPPATGLASLTFGGLRGRLLGSRRAFSG